MKFWKDKSLAQNHIARKTQSPEAQTHSSFYTKWPVFVHDTSAELIEHLASNPCQLFPVLFLPCVPYHQCPFLTQKRMSPLFWLSIIPSFCFPSLTLFSKASLMVCPPRHSHHQDLGLPSPWETCVSYLGQPSGGVKIGYLPSLKRPWMIEQGQRGSVGIRLSQVVPLSKGCLWRWLLAVSVYHTARGHGHL